MKAPKVKRIKGEAEYFGGNPYRMKPDVEGEGMFSMKPRNWFGKKPPRDDFDMDDMKGKPAFDNGRMGE